jgi:membrane-associated phospholipid phosphatase
LELLDMTIDPRPVPPSEHPTRRVAVVISSLAIVVLAALTTAVVLQDGPLPGEVAIIRWLQSFAEPIPAIAGAIRLTTGTEANLLVGAVPAVWAVRRHGRRGLAAMVILLVAMLVVQPVSKELVDRDRPDETQVEVRAEHTSRSYPSGHSLSTTAVWGTAGWYTARIGRRWAAAASVPIASTAVASGIEGVHWVSDSIAGMIIGGVAAWGAAGLLRRPRTAR